MRTILFACIHNAGRSQMAAALFNHFADPVKACALSAGTQPAESVHGNVITVMREIGIDLAGATPRLLTSELAAEADLLVTMGCGEDCPFVPGLPHEDWPLPDPKGQDLTTVRAIRDKIAELVRVLLQD